jgi:hypothetical protein
MSFLSDVITFIRHYVDDTDECNYSYTDDRLEALVYVSASYVNFDMNTEYTISVSGRSISPTPDSLFANLVALKSACLLVRSEQTSYSKMDFRVSDGPSTVDLKGAADKLKQVGDSICEQYARALNRYLMGVGGYGILTPNSGV